MWSLGFVGKRRFLRVRHVYFALGGAHELLHVISTRIAFLGSKAMSCATKNVPLDRVAPGNAQGAGN